MDSSNSFLAPPSASPRRSLRSRLTLAKLVQKAISGWRPQPANETRLGQYKLERKLGEGGMGVVYEARHPMLERRVAIKLLPAHRAGDEALARFEREVQVTARLSHPNIVPVYDCGRASDGSVYYAMEYLDGVDLERLVADNGPQPAARVVHVLLQAAEALAEAHDAGVVHRDIKPGNLILCDHPRRPDTLKVVDFGLVKDLASGQVQPEEDLLAGTPLYMTPEAVTNPRELDGRADLYALGAVGYFLLTGKPPFSGKSVVDVLRKHLDDEPVPPSARGGAVPSDLESVILWCLEKNPANRPQSASELVDALRRCRDATAWATADARAWWSDRAAA